MTQSGIDADKHYSVLFGGNKDSIRIRIACGSGADVFCLSGYGSFCSRIGRRNREHDGRRVVAY